MDGDYDTETGEVFEAPPLAYRRSPQCGELFAALAKAQAQVKNAVRDSTNPHFRSKYSDLTSVKEACWEALTANGIAPVQMPINGAGTSVGVVTLLGHSSGQWIESTIFVAPGRFDAQGVGSIITYLRRYALAAMAGVAPEDDDGNAAVAAPEARTTQEAGAPPGAYPRRQQAASAPRGAAAEARKRWAEIAAGIDNDEKVADVEAWDGCQAWSACEKLIAEAEGEAVAKGSMEKLRTRIQKKKAALLETGEVGQGYELG